MNYKLAELIDLEECKVILENFCEAVNIGSAISDLDGNVLIGIRWQKICTGFHRVNEETCKLCIESDTQLANELKEGKEYTIYKCKNGMTDAASPIIVEGVHLANIFVGQFLLDTPDREFFRAKAYRYGFDEQEYLSALDKVPIVPEKKVPHILGFMTSFAQTIARMGLEKLRKIQLDLELEKHRYNLEDLVSQRAEELAINRRRIGRILETANEGYWFINNDLATVEINAAMCAILERKKEEIIGRTVFEFVDEENLKIFKHEVAERKKGKTGAYEIALQRPDGTNIPCLFNATPFSDDDGNRIGSFAMVKDITEQKKVEEALRLSEERFDLATQAANVGLWDWNMVENTIYFSDQWLRMLGYEPGELPCNFDSWTSLLHPDDRKAALDSVNAYLERIAHSRELVMEKEYRMRCKDGGFRWILDLGRVIEWTEDGKPSRFIGTHTDISARKTVEQELSLLNFKADTALELTKAGHWHVPLDGSGWYNSSKRTMEINGDIPNEKYRYRLMEDWFTYVEAGDLEASKRTRENFNEAVEGKIPVYDTIYAYKRPVDGNVVWMHALGHVVKDESGKPTDMYGVTQDITAYVKAQEELKERMTDLERFSRLTINREEKMIQLKEEINSLLNQMGKDQKYKIVE